MQKCKKMAVSLLALLLSFTLASSSSSVPNLNQKVAADSTTDNQDQVQPAAPTDQTVMQPKEGEDQKQDKPAMQPKEPKEMKDQKSEKFKKDFVENTNDLNQKLDELINAKLQDLSTTTDPATLAKIKEAMTSLKGDLMDKFTSHMNEISVFKKTAGDNVNKQQSFTADILKTLDQIETASPGSKDAVENLKTMLTSRIWPVKYLEKFNEIAKKAYADALDGKDPSATLGEITSQNSSDDKELNKELSHEGLWAFPDVNQDAWYANSANEAASLGIVQGTENADGFKDLRPEAKLNCAEGIAMLDKAAGLKPDENVSTDVAALADNIDWAKPFLQAMTNVVGIDKVKSEIDACGGIGGDMKRDNFADAAVAVYEKLTGKTLDINAQTEIGQYSDFNQMNDNQKSDFAKAHDIGFITGADNGKRADFKGTAIRAEAAKMLIVLHKELAKLGLLKDNVPMGKAK